MSLYKHNNIHNAHSQWVNYKLIVILTESNLIYVIDKIVCLVVLDTEVSNYAY